MGLMSKILGGSDSRSTGDYVELDPADIAASLDAASKSAGSSST